jgi:multidrug efflux pump subunit AcrA (membrane-fusion protein)
LITIVPDNTPVEMVCYIKNMDIADIEIGMEAEVKLEAYPYNKYGTVKGTVKYISPSAFSSEQMGSVYLVKVEITNVPDGIDVISGLSGSVEIKTDKRTVMEYFLEPIIKGFGESLKEK